MCLTQLIGLSGSDASSKLLEQLVGGLLARLLQVLHTNCWCQVCGRQWQQQDSTRLLVGCKHTEHVSTLLLNARCVASGPLMATTPTAVTPA